MSVIHKKDGIIFCLYTNSQHIIRNAIINSHWLNDWARDPSQKLPFCSFPERSGVSVCKEWLHLPPFPRVSPSGLPPHRSEEIFWYSFLCYLFFLANLLWISNYVHRFPSFCPFWSSLPYKYFGQFQKTQPSVHW